MHHLTAPQLATYLESNKPLLLDVREPWEYRLCHIDGSRHIPMRHIPEIIDQLPADEDIIVICHHGIRSRAVCHYLEQQGFSSTINLTGGVDAWARQVDTSMQTY